MIDAAGTHVIYEVKHLEKSFGKVEVLKDINIQIGNGEVLTIIGSVRFREEYFSPLPESFGKTDGRRIVV